MSVFLLYGSETFLLFNPFIKLSLSDIDPYLILSLKFGEFEELPLDELIESLLSESLVVLSTDFFLLFFSEETFFPSSFNENFLS